MGSATLRFSPAQGAAGSDKTIVIVSDSLQGTGSEEATIRTNFQGWGDRIAAELSGYGISRYRNTWTGTNTTSGTSPRDITYRDLGSGGSRASNWAGTSAGLSAQFTTHVDYLIVMLGYNDCNVDPTGYATYTTNLTARLDEWTNVGRKISLLSWIPTATYLQQWYDAWAAGVAAATPGYRQSSVVGVNFTDDAIAYRNPGTTRELASWSYDGTHLNDVGHAGFFDRYWPKIKAAI